MGGVKKGNAGRVFHERGKGRSIERKSADPKMREGGGGGNPFLQKLAERKKKDRGE